MDWETGQFNEIFKMLMRANKEYNVLLENEVKFKEDE